MAKTPFTKATRTFIEAAVEDLFERAKARLLGPDPSKRTALGGKSVMFSYHPHLTLGSLFEAATTGEGLRTANMDLLAGLLRISRSYLDAQKEKTKAMVIQNVQSFLQDAYTKGVKTDVVTVLGGQLAETWGKVHSDVKRIVETESTVVRNMGVDDAIQRVSAMAGVEDPDVFFVVVRDGKRCSECTRLHLMPDGVTPRVWKRSEVKAGYHTKGDPTPSVGGLHPHCRCVMSVLMPGFGFDGAGKVVYKGKSQ